MSGSGQIATGVLGSSALASGDWSAFAPPYRGWDRSIEHLQAAAEQRIAVVTRSARDSGALRDARPGWLEFLRRDLQVAAFVTKGLQRILERASARCPWPAIARCLSLQARAHERQSLSIVLHASDIEAVIGVMPIEASRARWQGDAAWRDARTVLERLERREDWAEAAVVVNLCFEPLVSVPLRRDLGMAAASAAGDSVTPTIAEAGQVEHEWAVEWTLALTRFAVTDPVHGQRNRELLTSWTAEWLPAIERAAAQLAQTAARLCAPQEPALSLAGLRAEHGRLLHAAGIARGAV